MFVTNNVITNKKFEPHKPSSASFGSCVLLAPLNLTTISRRFDPSPLFLAPVDHLPREVLAATNGDAHAEMLARLAHELADRKRLRARVAELQAECAAQSDANAKVETFLDGLKGKLAGLADTSRPLQQFMHLPNAARSDSERATTAALPTPLYVLFAAANGYREACDASLGVRIDGDVAAAAQFVVDNDKPLTPFPLAVLLMFQLGGAVAGQSSTVPIRCAYLPSLNLVTVTVLTAELKAAGIGSQDVLVNLIPDDKGDVSPNPAHHFGAQSRAIKFDAAARPYRWAQCLGGLDFVPLARSPQLDQRASVAAILGMLKERLVARRALATQIKSLSE
jgi:THO complex subunit 5